MPFSVKRVTKLSLVAIMLQLLCPVASHADAIGWLNIPTIQMVEAFPNSGSATVTWTGPSDDQNYGVTDYAYSINEDGVFKGFIAMGNGFSLNGSTYSYSISGLGRGVVNSISIAPVQLGVVNNVAASIPFSFNWPASDVLSTKVKTTSNTNGWSARITNTFMASDTSGKPTKLIDNYSTNQYGYRITYSPNVSFQVTAVYGAINPKVVGPDSDGKLTVTGINKGQLVGVTLKPSYQTMPITVWALADSSESSTVVSTPNFSGSVSLASNNYSADWLGLNYSITNNGKSSDFPVCRAYALDANGSVMGQQVVPIDFPAKPGETWTGPMFILFRQSNAGDVQNIGLSCQ